MNAQALAGLVLLVVAILLANLPFVSDRVLGVVARRHAKPAVLRFGELFACYAITLLLARFVESRFVPPAPQGWEFYGVTACLFIVLAYPGFVWRYLMRHRRDGVPPMAGDPPA